MWNTEYFGWKARWEDLHIKSPFIIAEGIMKRHGSLRRPYPKRTHKHPGKAVIKHASSRLIILYHGAPPYNAFEIPNNNCIQTRRGRYGDGRGEGTVKSKNRELKPKPRVGSCGNPRNDESSSDNKQEEAGELNGKSWDYGIWACCYGHYFCLHFCWFRPFFSLISLSR